MPQDTALPGQDLHRGNPFKEGVNSGQNLHFHISAGICCYCCYILFFDKKIEPILLGG
jgi:hypothetical protein